MKFQHLLPLFILVMLVAGCSSGNNAGPTIPEQAADRGSFSQMTEGMDNITVPDPAYWEGATVVDGLTWVADLDEDGNVRWACGEGIPVDDPLAFIDSHPDIFRISSSRLHTSSDAVHGDVRYCIYRQEVDGIPLYDTRIDLRLKFGKVILIGVDVDESVTSLPAASLGRNQAVNIAYSYHPDDTLHACTLLAKRYDSGMYLPFWRVYIGDYYMEIAGTDGTVLVDEEHLYDYEFTGQVSGYVSEINPLDDFPLLPLFSLDTYFYEESAYAPTDEFGNYSLYSDDYNEQLTYVTPTGPYADIERYDYTTAYIEETTYDNVRADFTFYDDNSKHAERNVFYYTNVGHDYIKGIEPSFEELDFPVVSSVERGAWCNAMAGWGVMYYYKAQSPCINLGWIPDVILHEYGHEEVFFHYWSVDEAECPYDIHEGCADYNAATVTDQPIIGTNWRGPGTHIRNCNNSLWWPDNNCGGESHCLGQILAGAFWDVRKRLGRETTDHLWHFAKYGIPQTFPEYAMEMCVVDDDDGDLANGTPNFSVLYTAFDKIHGIPMPAAPDYFDLDLSAKLDVEPINISNATGGSFGYTLHVTNNIGQNAPIEAWVAVKRPIGLWYGPIVPPTHYIGIPVNLTFKPYQDFQYHIVQNIPAGLPVGATFEYHVRIGDYVDLVNDKVYAEDTLLINIVP